MVSSGNALSRAGQAVKTLLRGFGRVSGQRETPVEPTVFAITHCYPTRTVLYSAAFQGHWRVDFLSSLSEAVEASRIHRPKAVFFEDEGTGVEWRWACAALARAGIPFILLARRSSDETFLVVLSHGGYHVWGDPLTSGEVVRALELAEEVADSSRIAVG